MQAARGKDPIPHSDTATEDRAATFSAGTADTSEGATAVTCGRKKSQANKHPSKVKVTEYFQTEASGDPLTSRPELQECHRRAGQRGHHMETRIYKKKSNTDGNVVK